jgi:hypothetical protein
MLHETFIDHPDYDAEHLPEFLQSDIYMRVFVERELTGIFTADLFRTDGEPVLYLSVGLVTGHGRSGGNLMPLSMGLIIDLASQAFGLDDFFVALRTANPRVIAKLWQSRWVCFYPRRDWHSNDPRITNLRQHFCTQAFGADRCDLHGIIFYDIYPTRLGMLRGPGTIMRQSTISAAIICAPKAWMRFFFLDPLSHHLRICREVK